MIRKDSETAKAGYSEGFVIRPDYLISTDNTVLASVGDKVYNCHPYHRKIKGYGIRWELSKYEISHLPKRQQALLGCIPFDPKDGDTHSLKCECSLCNVIFDEQPIAPERWW